MYLQGRLRHYFVVLFLSVFWGLLHVIVLAGILLYTRKKLSLFLGMQCRHPIPPLHGSRTRNERGETLDPLPLLRVRHYRESQWNHWEKGVEQKREKHLSEGCSPRKPASFLSLLSYLLFCRKKGMRGKTKMLWRESLFHFPGPVTILQGEIPCEEHLSSFHHPIEGKGLRWDHRFQKTSKRKIFRLASKLVPKGHV